MITFIITMIIILALLLVLVVLAQNSKGGGLSSQFGGSGASQLVGVKRTTDILERITWGLAITMVVLTVSGTILMKGEASQTQQMTSPNIERAQQQIMPSLNDGILLDNDTDGGSSDVNLDELFENED
jgi:preprotein translocase subunit SecG